MTERARPAPPRRPEEHECCARGCEPCIFDYYHAALDRWAARMRDLGFDPEAVPPPRS